MEYFNLFASLTLLIITGFLLGKLKKLPINETKVINGFLIVVALPASIFTSIVSLNKENLGSYLNFALINLVLFSVIIFLSYLFLQKFIVKDRKTLGAAFQAASIGNIVFLGFPIIETLLGKESLAYASIYAAIFFLVLAFIPAFILVESKEKGLRLKRTLKVLFTNFILVATLIAITVLVSGIKVPEFIFNPLFSIASTTTPLALISIGLFLSKEFKLENYKVLTSVIAFKLILMPSIIYIILKTTGWLHDNAFLISVLMALMPTAAIVSAFVEEDKLDNKLAVNAIILSTILFLPALFIWIYILGI